MQSLMPLDRLTPADLWREVPEEEDKFWQEARVRQAPFANSHQQYPH